ncbi:hypothetical protein [Aurantimonas coralicida]|uniref:hypothetical protein n=1 Tax=Aurantimonas coralicida TaxID=182270 RepID=UPI001E651C4A|nr:hypothetical protein [Aurantimonas coralicida]MCD1642570.1 hypothetical protein [Aurantimonas coralicida]
MSRVETEMQQRILNNAVAFYEAGRRAKEKQCIFIAEGVEPRSLGAPQVVCLAFSVELFLKLIGLMEGKTPPRDHNLRTLFDLLSDSTRAEIERRYVYESVAPIAEELGEMADVFKNWRYFHEAEFLIASPDALVMIAELLRGIARDKDPKLFSAFET